MIKVTKKSFYETIGPLDIIVTSRLTDYSSFQTRTGIEIGRAVTVGDDIDERGFSVVEYFVTEDFYMANKVTLILR